MDSQRAAWPFDLVSHASVVKGSSGTNGQRKERKNMNCITSGEHKDALKAGGSLFNNKEITWSYYYTVLHR